MTSPRRRSGRLLWDRHLDLVYEAKRGRAPSAANAGADDDELRVAVSGDFGEHDRWLAEPHLTAIATTPSPSL